MVADGQRPLTEKGVDYFGDKTVEKSKVVEEGYSYMMNCRHSNPVGLAVPYTTNTDSLKHTL